MSEILKTMLNRIEHNKNALKNKKYYVEDLISNEELIILVEEIERLNNIINELEKWLLEEHKKKQKWYNEQLSTNDKRYYEEKYLTSLTMINVFFDKIKELKGSDKE